MAKVFKGRYTSQIDEPFVVFINGMRFNKLWVFSRWIPAAAAIGPVVRTLYTQSEKGFLWAEGFLLTLLGSTPLCRPLPMWHLGWAFACTRLSTSAVCDPRERTGPHSEGS